MYTMGVSVKAGKSWYLQFWSKISQNKFKLGDRVWISYGQNYVFFTSSFKPTVVLFGGFSEFDFFNFRSQITLKILCFFMFSSTGVPMGLARVPKISNLERFLYFW